MILGSLLSTARGWMSGSSVKTYALIISGVAVAALVGWLFWSRAELKADVAAAEAHIVSLRAGYQASQAALVELTDEAARMDRALAARDAELKEISAQRDAARTAWEEVKRHDSTARDWAAARIPDAVRGLLRQE
ncbi:MAG: hypothetical protein AB7E32_09260 [Desulfovibrio sp.]